jgi:hypothetical protein
MPVKVAYSYRNKLISEFLNPKKAYKTLLAIGKPSFLDFFVPLMPNPTKGKSLGILLVGGLPDIGNLTYFGGVVICGTKEELDDFFYQSMKQPGRVAGVSWYGEITEKDPDYLLTFFVRGKSLLGDTEILICIGPKRQWWGCVNTAVANFKPGKWLKYPGIESEERGINFNELRDGLENCEKDFDGKKVPVIDW